MRLLSIISDVLRHGLPVIDEFLHIAMAVVGEDYGYEYV